MPPDNRFGPMCREQIAIHHLTDIFTTDSGEPPEGQLFKPALSEDEVTDRLSEFLEDLFERAFALQATPNPANPDPT